MADPTNREGHSAFLKTLRTIAPHKHRYDVFRDFVILAATSLHNSTHKDEAREAEYLQVIAGYSAEDQQLFPKLLGQLIQLLDPTPADVLGPIYLELDVANRDQGQFFTPPDVSYLMAKMTWGEELANCDRPFITLGEPACGAGGMVLAFVRIMIENGQNPAEKLWVQCIDVDRLAALMCYVQLTLWNVPGEVIVGNTISWQHREIWYTPAHHLGFWNAKLARRAEQRDGEDSGEAKDELQPPAVPTNPAAQSGPVQFDFEF